MGNLEYWTISFQAMFVMIEIALKTPSRTLMSIFSRSTSVIANQSHQVSRHELGRPRTGDVVSGSEDRPVQKLNVVGLFPACSATVVSAFLFCQVTPRQLNYAVDIRLGEVEDEASSSVVKGLALSALA